MSVHTIRDFIVVSKDSTHDEVSRGGIVMIKQETKNVTGTVLSVGSGRVSMNGTVIPLDVHEGDKVVFNKSMASEVQDGHDTVYVLREDQVIAILR